MHWIFIGMLLSMKKIKIYHLMWKMYYCNVILEYTGDFPNGIMNSRNVIDLL